MKGGLLIKESRLRTGLTQKELAERLETTQSVVARWESGRRSPTFETVVRAIRACGLDLHPSIAAYDDQDDLQIAQNRRRSPEELLAMNRGIHEVAAKLRAAESAR